MKTSRPGTGMSLVRAAAAIVLIALGSSALAQQQWTSDGQPPINCKTGHLPTEVFCRGRYCDDIGLTCSPELKIGKIVQQYWTRQSVSEENGFIGCAPVDHERDNNTRFLTGFKCQGDYSDNIQIQCTKYQMPDGLKVVGKRCKTTDYFSEEQARQVFAAEEEGFYPVAMRCRGSYCDSISFDICHLETAR